MPFMWVGTAGSGRLRGHDVALGASHGMVPVRGLEVRFVRADARARGIAQSPGVERRRGEARRRITVAEDARGGIHRAAVAHPAVARPAVTRPAVVRGRPAIARPAIVRSPVVGGRPAVAPSRGRAAGTPTPGTRVGDLPAGARTAASGLDRPTASRRVAVLEAVVLEPPPAPLPEPVVVDCPPAPPHSSAATSPRLAVTAINPISRRIARSAFHSASTRLNRRDPFAQILHNLREPSRTWISRRWS